MDKNLEAELKALTPEQRQIEEGIAAWLAKHDELRRQQVKAATLRAVGEAFQERAFIISSVSADLDGKPCVALEQSDLTALRNGQWPAGWERKVENGHQ